MHAVDFSTFERRLLFNREKMESNGLLYNRKTMNFELDFHINPMAKQFMHKHFKLMKGIVFKMKAIWDWFRNDLFLCQFYVIYCWYANEIDIYLVQKI